MPKPHCVDVDAWRCLSTEMARPPHFARQVAVRLPNTTELPGAERLTNAPTCLAMQRDTTGALRTRRSLAYNRRHCLRVPSMAIGLLVALIALGLLHALPQLARWRGDSLFRRWVAQLADTSGSGRVALALLPPLACVHCCGGCWDVHRWVQCCNCSLHWPCCCTASGHANSRADLEAILEATDGAGRRGRCTRTRRRRRHR